MSQGANGTSAKDGGEFELLCNSKRTHTMPESVFLLFTLIALNVINIDEVSAQSFISIESLLDEMLNRESMARLPNPVYISRQSSIFNRNAVSPDGRTSWFVDMDCRQFLRVEEYEGRKEYIMHDAGGPGAIVRVWATWYGPRGEPFSDVLRVYIDEVSTPAIEMLISKFVAGGLIGAPLSQDVSKDTEFAKLVHNLCLPIPYAKHCKITYSTDVLADRGAHQGEALYYQINYRTYGNGVHVESFYMERLADAKSVVDQAIQVLANDTRQSFDAWPVIEESGKIKPRSSSDSTRIIGPAAIRSLECRLEADDLEQTLRSTVLEIQLDGPRSIWSPLGVFFASGCKLTPHRTWFTDVRDNVLMSCTWVMPFAKESLIRIHNLGN